MQATPWPFSHFLSPSRAGIIQDFVSDPSGCVTQEFVRGKYFYLLVFLTAISINCWLKLILSTVLLRYHAHTIHPFKCTVQWHLIYSVIEPSPQSVLQQFHHPKKETMYPLAYNPYNSPAQSKHYYVFCLYGFTYFGHSI